MEGAYDFIVTGCTGYVGNVFTKKLLDEGYSVVGFARSEKKAKRVFGERLPALVLGDVSKQEDVFRLFEHADEHTVVIHTVAKVSIGESSKEELESVTVRGTQNVVNACLEKKVKKLLHVSSTEAIPSTWKLDEELTGYLPDPAHTKKGYAQAKSKADKIVYDATQKGLDGSFIMLASVLGPGDYGVGHMSQLFKDYIEGRLPASISAGYNDFDIRDVADVLPAIVEKSKKAECYIFANQPNMVNDDLAVISQKLGLKKLVSLPLWLAYVGLPFLWLWAKLRGKRPLYTAAALSSLGEKADFPLTKVRREFGYSPRPLAQTVSDQIDFMIAEGLVEV